MASCPPPRSSIQCSHHRLIRAPLAQPATGWARGVTTASTKAPTPLTPPNRWSVWSSSCSGEELSRNVWGNRNASSLVCRCGSSPHFGRRILLLHGILLGQRPAPYLHQRHWAAPLHTPKKELPWPLPNPRPDQSLDGRLAHTLALGPWSHGTALSTWDRSSRSG